MIVPMLHSNGTSGDALLNQMMAARVAMLEAISVVTETAPNGRDYYTQGDKALSAATEEHKSRISRLYSVTDELEAIAEAICDQMNGGE
jgi:hypothetical protein